MLEFLYSVLAALRVFVCSRSDTALEVLALRQQVAVLKRQRPRPTLTRLDRFFWTTLRHLWPRWSDVLLIVKPETVVRWHRAGFRLYWRWLTPTGSLDGPVSGVPAAGRFDSRCPSNVHSGNTSASAANHRDPRPICCGSGSGYTQGS